MKKLSILIMACFSLLFLSCFDEPELVTSAGSDPSDLWAIPQTEVFDGGPGKDGIPSVDNPQFTPVAEVDFMLDDELVVAINYGATPRAYPHKILNWHEIVNDNVANISVSINYCPLTGTGMGWDRVVNGEETTFGVSGLLYNSNLIPYDRASDSNWSQMKHQCVNGELKSQLPETYHLVEMPYRLFKEMYPEGWVMNLETGFDREYDTYPYGSYRTNASLLFPIDNDDSRHGRKKRVLGVTIDDEVKAYVFESFNGNQIQIIEDELASEELIIIGSELLNFLTAYNRTLDDGTLLSFTPLQNQYPSVMIDNEGTEWDVFGVAVKGPNQGARLSAPLNYIGYWFAWATFNPDIAVY